MPRVLITGDGGAVFWDERVAACDFESGHFRRQLADRLAWAVADAEAAAVAPTAGPGLRAVEPSTPGRQPLAA